MHGLINVGTAGLSFSPADTNPGLAERARSVQSARNVREAVGYSDLPAYTPPDTAVRTPCGVGRRAWALRVNPTKALIGPLYCVWHLRFG